MVYLALAVVVDGHFEEFAMVAVQGLGVMFVIDLLEGYIGGLVDFEFYDNGWLVGDIGEEDEVGYAFANGDLFEDGVILYGSEISQVDGTLQGGFVVVGQDGANAGVGIAETFGNLVGLEGNGVFEELVALGKDLIDFGVVTGTGDN